MTGSPTFGAALCGREDNVGGNRNWAMAKMKIECIVWLTLGVSINVDRRMS